MLGTFGSKVKSSPMGQLRVAESTRLIGAAFSDSVVLDVNFWGSTAVGSGTIVPGNNQVSIQTGATSASSGTLLSVRTGRYVAGNSNFYRGVVRAPAVTGENRRRWGAYGATNGFFFEHDGTALSVVSRKNGVDTKVSNGSFNGDAGNTYAIGTSVATYEIYWTSTSAWFLVGDVIIHKATGTDAPLAATSSLPTGAECANAPGNTANNILEIRAATVSRIGQASTQPHYKYIAAAGTNICKYSPGVLQRVVLDNPDGAVQVITISDSAGNYTPIISQLNVPNGNNVLLPTSIDYGLPFYNGLTVITSTGNGITVIYE